VVHLLPFFVVSALIRLRRLLRRFFIAVVGWRLMAILRRMNGRLHSVAGSCFFFVFFFFFFFSLGLYRSGLKRLSSQLRHLAISRADMTRCALNSFSLFLVWILFPFRFRDADSKSVVPSLLLLPFLLPDARHPHSLLYHSSIVIHSFFSIVVAPLRPASTDHLSFFLSLGSTFQSSVYIPQSYPFVNCNY